MHLPKERLVILGVLLLTFAVSIAAWPAMPDRMATHWGFTGEADGSLPRPRGLLLVPLISCGLAALLLVVPRFDPLKANVEEFRGTYEGFIAAFLLFMLYVHAFVILWNLGIRISVGQALAPAFAALMYSVGVLVGHAKPNWFIGIRTPWTLSSETVWAKTHALGGKLFRLAGAIALLGILLPGLAVLFILVPAVGVSLYLVVYSYREYRKEGGLPGKGPRA